MDEYKQHMIYMFSKFHEDKMGILGCLSAADLFSNKEAQAIVTNLSDIPDTIKLNKIIGGETIDGQLDFLMDFHNDPLYHEQLDYQRKLREEAEEIKKQKKREAGARYRANRRSRLLLASATEPAGTMPLAKDLGKPQGQQTKEMRKQKKKEANTRYRANKRARDLAAAKSQNVAGLGSGVSVSEDDRHLAAAEVDSARNLGAGDPGSVAGIGTILDKSSSETLEEQAIGLQVGQGGKLDDNRTMAK
ncbi:hypothetical protein PtB15_9B21 [Puccinia triticina]|nr:hypothetical protein PtB15_9B21 [Puccinia triticina]